MTDDELTAKVEALDAEQQSEMLRFVAGGLRREDAYAIASRSYAFPVYTEFYDCFEAAQQLMEMLEARRAESTEGR